MEKLFAPIAKRIAVVIIAFCSVLVLLNVAASAYFNPKTVVEREISSLAEEYYEDYLYGNLVGNRTGDAIGEEMKHYKDIGVPNTYLRQLLLYDSGRRKEASGYFDQKGFKCDRNKTYVKYFPEEPYEKKNYHFEIKLVCE
ncbi:MAG: hypothetical protein Q4A25_02325 [Candidatus Saccharibacteria bacterium]|nr:hypothetical protein [Candidatus Saccharibacteria bacterium]